MRPPHTQNARVAAGAILLGTMLLLPGAPSGASGAPPAPATAAAAAELEAERLSVELWRAGRILRLTSDSGWLTLAGLFWLKEGDNSFGRASSNALVLDNAPLADTAGSFMVTGERVRFLARPGAGVTHDGRAVTSLDLASDARGEPTVLASGSLRFFVIERAGDLGVRGRDLDNPHRRNFGGLSYFPVSTDWVFNARFEPYEPAHHLQIVNILGMEEEAQSPGAVVFRKNGREWGPYTVLETPGDSELFIMFADSTSAHETYGAGRFLYIPLPKGETALVDFNKAFNPPCALNDFATWPLPPSPTRPT